MASHGQVLDLFNERYLEIHDVFGNVEPLPTLVPYQNYTQNVLVYRMDTVHDIFMALIQDFTDRTAHSTRKELWTWCVQWEVEEAASRELAAAPHTPKKPRLNASQPATPSDTYKSRPQRPAYTAQRRIINPALMLEDDMLRILIDIVQVDSSIVPNFIEFLYRWVDFYEGDGKALKAALSWEIPSLWDFEYHPLVLPEDVKKRINNAKAAEDGAKADNMKEAGNKTPSNRTDELAQGSPTKKMREKPDLAALEQQTAESERLQYREVHYGIQPPKLNEPLSPLINIPRDQQKRTKYYAACFKSRQRALYLLLEAGITTQQIKNYKKMQKFPPRDTPQEGKGDGLRHYEKDASFAQHHFVAKEKQMLLRNKQMEITISNKLAMEAQLAAQSTVTDESAGIPLIPPTPSYAHRPGMADAMLLKIRAARKIAEGRINAVPISLVDMMKSQLFENAKDKRTLYNELRVPSESAFPRPAYNSGTNTVGLASSSDSEDGDDDNDDGAFGTDNHLRTSSRSGSTAAFLSHPSLPRPSLPSPLPPPNSTAASHQPQNTFISNAGSAPTLQLAPSNTGVPSQGISSNNTRGPANITEYMRNLTPDQARQLLPFVNPEACQTLTNILGAAAPAQPPLPNARASNNTGISTPNLPPATSNALAGLPLLSQPPPRVPSITVSVPHIPNAPSHYPLLQGFERQANPFVPQRSPELPRSPFLQGENSHDQGLSQFGGPNGDQLHPSGYGSMPPQQFSSFQQQSYLNRPNRPPNAQLPSSPWSGQSASGPFSMQAPSHLPRANAPNPILPPPRGGMTRNAPTPLTLHLQAPPCPLSSLAPSLLATSPFTASRHGTPIQILLPKIVVPGNTIGPGGRRLGNGGVSETDALLLGYTQPGSGKIVLSRAIFLPVGVWSNTLERVRKGKYSVLETYAGPDSKQLVPNGPHKAVYEKLRMAYDIMHSAPNREEDLTKRWRVTKGPMTAVDRGAVWEGWAVTLDREIALDGKEREGAYSRSGYIDEGVEGKVDPEGERRRRVIDELLEEDEDEDADMEG